MNVVYTYYSSSEDLKTLTCSQTRVVAVHQVPAKSEEEMVVVSKLQYYQFGRVVDYFERYMGHFKVKY